MTKGQFWLDSWHSCSINLYPKPSYHFWVLHHLGFFSNIRKPLNFHKTSKCRLCNSALESSNASAKALPSLFDADNVFSLIPKPTLNMESNMDFMNKSWRETWHPGVGDRGTINIVSVTWISIISWNLAASGGTTSDHPLQRSHPPISCSITSYLKAALDHNSLSLSCQSRRNLSRGCTRR